MTKLNAYALLLAMPIILFTAPRMSFAHAGKKAAKCDSLLAPSWAIPGKFHGDPARIAAGEALQGALNSIGVELDSAAIAGLFETPPDPKMGQIAFPTFQMAKRLKKAPPQIAKEILAGLGNASIPYISKIEVAGPYLNFHIDNEEYLNWMGEEIASGRYFESALAPAEREKVSVEFSQPNTHKALHVGHLRNMFLGESVARLLQLAGHRVVRATYPGDMGTHVAKVLWYIRTHKNGEIPKSADAEWLGRMYAEADQYVRSADSADVKAGIDAMLKSIECGQGPEHEFYALTREWSLEQMRSVYSWLGIHFDQWHFESECDAPSKRLVLEKLKAGLVTQDDGAVGLDLKDEGLGFVLMLKKDGSGLYLTKDLDLLKRKFEDPELSRAIVVVDARQKLHFQQVFRAAEILGISKAAQSLHLSYETVTDRDGGALSSRTLLDGLTLWQLKGRLENDRDALNSLRLGFLRTAARDQLRFDMDQWLKKGNSAADLKAMAGRMTQAAATQAQPGALDEEDQALAAHLAKFRSVLETSIRELDPSGVARYVSELRGLAVVCESKAGGINPRLARVVAGVFEKSFWVLGLSD